MSFLNPAILWGLAALAVPIIVHFFNLQRPKTVLFSNIALVKEVQKNVTRRLKLKQWLLLLARLLAVAAAVLAFANPVWVSKQSKLLRGNRSVAVVIDNSASMIAGNEKGAYLQQAIALTKNIFNTYTPQDEFLLLTTGDLTFRHNFVEREEALEQLQTLNIRQKVCTQNLILSSIGQIFERSNNRVKELYFLSDFQTSTVVKDTQQLKLSLDSSTLVKFVPLASRQQKNLYLTSHQLNAQIIEKNKPINLSFTVMNDGDKDVKDLGIRVNVDGKVVAISSQNIPAKSSQAVKMPFTPAASGWQSGYIELDDYPIEFDNKRYFSFYVPENEKILIIEGERAEGVNILYKDLFTQFQPTFISDKAISSVQFSEFRAIVFVGVKDISTGLSEKLNQFLNAGGGVMLFPGTGANLSTLNAFLQGIGVGQFGDLVSAQSGVKASQMDLESPLLEGVFAPTQKNKSLDAPVIFRYFPLTLKGGVVQSKILSLENSSPILTENKVGNGTLYLWSMMPNDAWTDFHVKTLFPPMMYRCTQLMSRTQAGAENQDLGKFSPLTVKTDKQDVIKLKGEKEQEYIPEQYVQNEQTILKFDKLDMQAGNYKLMQNDKELTRISFNISDQESKLAFTTSDELEDLLQKNGLDFVQVLKPEPYSITSTISVEKEGNPLWRIFLIVALLALLAEVLILRVFR